MVSIPCLLFSQKHIAVCLVVLWRGDLAMVGVTNLIISVVKFKKKLFTIFVFRMKKRKMGTKKKWRKRKKKRKKRRRKMKRKMKGKKKRWKKHPWKSQIENHSIEMDIIECYGNPLKFQRQRQILKTIIKIGIVHSLQASERCRFLHALFLNTSFLFNSLRGLGNGVYCQ
jgi:hypothetical protein